MIGSLSDIGLNRRRDGIPDVIGIGKYTGAVHIIEVLVHCEQRPDHYRAWKAVGTVTRSCPYIDRDGSLKRRTYTWRRKNGTSIHSESYKSDA
mgnify:CR=1 FL=1